MTTTGPGDPRPRTEEVAGRVGVTGMRCPSCGYVAAGERPRCPVCAAAVEVATFGPDGVVWSSTVVRVPTPERTPPYTLAYVDLDGGPRILAHVAGVEQPPAAGSPVRLREATALGDLQVEVRP